jgi:hypothetical protein
MQGILKEKYNNEKFYNANLAWLEDNNNKQAYDTMWIEITNACTSTIKKFVRKVPGIYNKDDILDFAIESAEKVMKSIIKNKTKVDNLSNFVFLFCYGVFYSVKRQQQNKKEVPFIYETHDIVFNDFEDEIVRKIDNEMKHY